MKRRVVVRVLCVLLSLLASSTIQAGTSAFSGNIGPDDPTITVVTIVTPDCVGQGFATVHYRAIPFTVDASGTYTFTDPNRSNAIYVYAGSFNPAAPLANCVAASNSNPINISEVLATGTNYVLVVIDDVIDQPGARFDVTISGPGNVHGTCAGFSDIDAANGFCANVHWLRNRAITLGCTTTTYCPNEPVTRLQMAVFMNRLGSAIAPVLRTATQESVQSAVNNGSIVCEIGEVDPVSFPRTATLASAMLYHRAASTVRVSSRIVYSLNGVEWLPMGAQTHASNVGNGYATQSPASASITVLPLQRVRFGLEPVAAAATIDDAGCQLTVRLESMSGTQAPHDAASPSASDVSLRASDSGR